MASTVRHRLISIRSVLERVGGFENELVVYSNLLQGVSAELKDVSDENMLTNSEKKNWMEWSDIIKVEDPSWSNEYRLVHGLFTLIPPRRLDYGYLRFIPNTPLEVAKLLDAKLNYIVTEKDSPSYIILNKYKTDYIYGQYIIDLNQPDNLPLFNYSKLKKLISDVVCDLKFNDPVFKSASFGITINNVFKLTGKCIGCNILRHSFVSGFLNEKTFANVSDNDLKLVSSCMANSNQMFMNYRRRDAV